MSRCVIEERQEKVPSGGLRKTTVVFDELRLPDGQVVRCDSGEAASAAKAQFSRQHPGPKATADATAPPSFDTWWNQEAKEVRAWSAAVFEEGQRRDLAWSARIWPYGFPIEKVLQELNRLKGEGWRLLQVSEDRGLYAGQDAQTESGVVTARYLLTRD